LDGDIGHGQLLSVLGQGFIADCKRLGVKKGKFNHQF
jgi:hypothetical protein